VPQGEGWLWGFFAPLVNGVFLKTEVYLTRAWIVDNISVRTTYRWKRPSVEIVRFKIEVGIYKKCAKM